VSRGAPSHLLAVDGGNTKTIALVADRAGRLRGLGNGGSSDIYHAASPAAAVDEIVAAATDAMAAAEIGAADLAVAAFGLAGADWPEDFRLLEDELGRRIPAGQPPLVVNDAIGALWSVAGADDGVVAVWGTYLAVGAAGPSGRWHSSFWQESAGAVPLAEAALDAIRRADLGTGPPTALSTRLLDAADARSVEELLHRFTCRARPPLHHLGQLAPVVLDTADDGDEAALGLVFNEARHVSLSVTAALGRTALFGPYELFLSGGLCRHPSRLLVEYLGDLLPDSTVTISHTQPVTGVAAMAADTAGFARLDEASVGNQQALNTFPPPTTIAYRPLRA
jgi:N-acetylglucosamine kinase-like BadF-type ATPase